MNEGLKENLINEIKNHELIIKTHLSQKKILEKTLLEYFKLDWKKEKEKIQLIESKLLNIPVKEPFHVSVFPSSSTKVEQAVWLFKNELKKISTLREAQNAYDKYNGNGDITMSIRLSKNLTENGFSKRDYGNNNVLWGLSEWYDESIDDFKKEFK